MTPTRLAIKDTRAQLADVVDEFLPTPAELIPDIALAAALELAAAVRRNDTAQAELAIIVEANRNRWPNGHPLNEQRRLLDERHPAAIEADEAERALRTAREVFRLEIVAHRDPWTAHLEQLAAADLAGAPTVVRDAITRIRAAAPVPATHTRRLVALEKMAQGHTDGDGGSQQPAPRG